MAVVSTSHFSIASYWKDKHICPDGSVALSHNTNTIAVIPDFGEPCCWGCGKPIIGGYEKARNNFDDIDYCKLWNDRKVKSRLNRCHIIPGQLSGQDSPENLFLMCLDCHATSPDTPRSKSFLRWVYDHRREYVMGSLRPDLMLAAVSAELTRRGVGTFEDVLRVLHTKQPDVKFKDIKDYLMDSMGSHGSAVVMSTRVNVLADYFQKKLLEVSLGET